MYRYRGENPNNWVCFGNSSITSSSSCDANHKWRIIGIDSNGRMKIMTNYYYSKSKAFDTTGGTNGSNNWERPADLNTELNDSLFYTNNDYIDIIHRGYIVNAIWYIGGNATKSSYLASDFVNTEKNNSTRGKVGLMSVVDFIYAAENCSIDIDLQIQNNVCMSDNWIMDNSTEQWTITPADGDLEDEWYINIGNKYNTFPHVERGYARNNMGVRPSIYLDSSVKITGGNGTESNPYILSK